MKRAFVVCLAVLFCAGAMAPALASERTKPGKAVTTQKAMFLERLVTDSVSARTILKSGDAAAIAKLEEARQLVAKAKTLVGQGEYRKADEMFDRALALVTSEARRLSADDVKSARAKEAFEKRRHTVVVFLSAHERVTQKNSNADMRTRANIIRRMLSEADALKADGQYEKGVAVLDHAYHIARDDIREAREGQKLVRSLVFETPRDAYEYELGRTQSHFLLLRFAIDEKKPQGSMLTAINGNREKAEQLRKRAIAKAKGGNYPEAIADLEAATGLLLKSIRMSGLYVPG